MSIECAFAALLFGITLALPLGTGIILSNLNAAVDIDASGSGSAAAFDGKEGIATDGDSFCSVADGIADSKFSSLFEGIVGDCNNSELSNQFLVDYSYTKNPVKIGEKTYLTITVKDKDTGNPIPNAFVTLDIQPPTNSFEDNTTGSAVAAAGISSEQEIVQDKTAQSMYTNNDGRATFTVQIGPKSDLGTYDTELKVSKDSYLSSFEQTSLRVA